MLATCRVERREDRHRADAPSALCRCGKRGQQVRRWLERRGRRAVRPPLRASCLMTPPEGPGSVPRRNCRAIAARGRIRRGWRTWPAVVLPARHQLPSTSSPRRSPASAGSPVLAPVLHPAPRQEAPRHQRPGSVTGRTAAIDTHLEAGGLCGGRRGAAARAFDRAQGELGRQSR